VEVTRVTVELTAAGARLDRWLTAHLPGLSRARLQSLIADGMVRVDGDVRKASHRLRGGELVQVTVPPATRDELTPEPRDLVIVHEDEDILVIDKPAGMVVHPGAGNHRGTLAAAVLAHAPEIAVVGGRGRPGIVHRLDKGTSGLLVLAKSQLAYDSLTAQLAARTMRRTYMAVVVGIVARGVGIVDAPIGRHPHDRVRMAIRPAAHGRRAVTRFRVVERFRTFSHLELGLETGRTHQIRVHMASLGHPVVGDATYGQGRAAAPVPIDGLALHAMGLSFLHPSTRNLVTFEAAIPARIEGLLCHLRNAG
jgi:23S rRNA pseudouridine1911/1915/1917 synthase